MNSKGSLRFINRGARDGVVKGMRFLVLRDGRPVGRVQAVAVHPHHAEVKVVEDLGGIQMQDRIRAIAREPSL